MSTKALAYLLLTKTATTGTAAALRSGRNTGAMLNKQREVTEHSPKPPTMGALAYRGKPSPRPGMKGNDPQATAAPDLGPSVQPNASLATNTTPFVSDS